MGIIKPAYDRGCEREEIKIYYESRGKKGKVSGNTIFRACDYALIFSLSLRSLLESAVRS